jgi:hypothetical protein
MTATAPTNVRVMPSPRCQPMRSPSSATERSVVMGTPSCTTTAALDGVAVMSPMVMSPKLPAPIRRPTTIVRHTGRGTGKSQGNTARSTTPSRTAEKNSGGM